MKITKGFALTIVAFFAINFVMADEWDDFGTSSGTSAVVISGSAEMAGRVYTDLREDGSSGERFDPKDMAVEGRPDARLNFDYNGASSDVSFKFKFNKNSLNEYKEDLLDEFTARAYLGNFQLEAGKMKVVWGKGDKVHVVDNFNANDYTDFIYPDYIDRRIAEPMLRLVYSTASNVKFEAIYTPMMSVDRLASGGIWQPYASAQLAKSIEGIAQSYLASVTLDKVKANNLASQASTLATLDADGTNAEAQLKALIEANKETLVQYGLDITSPATIMNTAISAIENYVVATETAYLTALSNSSSVASNLYPNTSTLKYGQAGARTTFTLGKVDLGFSYYYGHYKQPSADASKIGAYVTKVLSGETITEADKFLAYDRLQVFGLETATILWKFNLRGEGAYYLTKDTSGDDASVHNNSVQWVLGFDMDMPWTNMNLNVQTQGKYVMKNGKIKDSANPNDVDYNSDDKYINNKLIVNVSDMYAHETIKLDLKGILEVETKDFVIMPSVTIKAVDDFSVTASGMVIKTDNENSEFYNFRRNSFAQISCKYLF